MGSNYVGPLDAEEVHDDDDDWYRYEDPLTDPRTEVQCMRCRGTGLVEIHDQETDCLDCEGYGTVLI